MGMWVRDVRSPPGGLEMIGHTQACQTLWPQKNIVTMAHESGQGSTTRAKKNQCFEDSKNGG